MVLPLHRGVPTLLVLFFFTGLPSLQYWCLYTLLLLFRSRSCQVSTLKSQGLTTFHRLCSSSIHGSGGCPLYRSYVCPISLTATFSTHKTLLPWKTMAAAFAYNISCLESLPCSLLPRQPTAHLASPLNLWSSL